MTLCQQVTINGSIQWTQHKQIGKAQDEILMQDGPVSSFLEVSRQHPDDLVHSKRKRLFFL